MSESTTLLSAIANAVQTAPPLGFGQTGSIILNLMGGKLKSGVVQEILEKANASNDLSNEAIESNKGLLVSIDDLKNIFRYVDEALALPTTIESAEKYLGYKSDDDFFNIDSHKFLSPANQVEFDKPIIEHANQWASLEQSIKELGNSLVTYSKEFVAYGKDLYEVLEDLGKYIKLKDDKAKDVVDCAMEIMSNWKSITKKQSDKTGDLYKRLQSFSDRMQNNTGDNDSIYKRVKDRMDEIHTLNLSGEKSEIEEEVKNLEKEIDSLQSEYDELVGLAFTGAAGLVFGPIGIITWAVSGGVCGGIAEKIRKEKNDKKKDLKKLQDQLNAINRVYEGVNNLYNLTTSFQSAIASALVGVQHVRIVWDSVVENLERAYTHIKNFTETGYDSYIKNLMSELNIAVGEWQECGDITKELVELFDEARKDH